MSLEWCLTNVGGILMGITALFTLVNFTTEGGMTKKRSKFQIALTILFLIGTALLSVGLSM